MRRILVVDDEAHVTRLVQRRLLSEGYEAVTASNGLEALSRLEEGPLFDAVVTDFSMPKMNGRELCEAIRDRYMGESMFIFLVTANLEEPLREWAQGMPQVQYVEKPISLQDLIGRLAKCFGPEEGAAGSIDV